MEYTYRDSLIKINTKQLVSNINEIKTKCSPDKFLYVVVKANGYGQGLIKMSEIVKESMGDALAVARVDEALALRNTGCELDILFLGVVRKEDVLIACENDIVITINDIEHAKDVASVTLSKPLRVHLKYNTGMNRLGVNNVDDLICIIEILLTNEMIIIEGLFTHFATADGEEGYEYFKKQLNIFEDLIGLNLYNFKYIHCTNSGSLLKHHHEIKGTTADRVGISYCGYMEDSVKHLYNLKGTFQLVSRITNVKKYPKNTPISYGCQYYTQSDEEYIATIPLGYADGFVRMRSGALVKYQDQYGVIVGSICMDQLMISFKHPVKTGEEVLVIDHNDPKINFDTRAKEAGTIIYEVITGFNERIPVEYF